jgi:hypothetical protein
LQQLANKSILQEKGFDSFFSPLIECRSWLALKKIKMVPHKNDFFLKRKDDVDVVKCC